MKCIGLAPNPHKQEALELARELASWLTERGVRPLLTHEAANDLALPELGADEESVADSDLLVILGGDGTLLRWSRLAAPQGTPMLGINFGQYGFITEVQPDIAKTALQSYLEGNFYTSERVVLEATHIKEDREVGKYHALNDVVVSKGPLARMLQLHTHINGRFIVTYSADGIIIASPTGSTAYSLSAGGPVVHPNISALIITPICPHTLAARSLVVPNNEVIEIMGEYDKGAAEMMLTIDGQLGEHLSSGDIVKINKADYTAKLIQLEPNSFYNKLQTRLRWGERF